MPKKLNYKKMLKRGAITVFLVLLVGFLFLMFYGVPRPPAISTQGVPRVPWKPLFKTVSALKQILASTDFAAWYPSERRMLIHATSGLTPQLHVLSEPGGRPEKLMFLRDMGREIRFNPDTNKNYFVFSMDVNGDERYQLYRFNLSDRTYHRFTDGTSRNYAGYFDSQGNVFAYASMKLEGGTTSIYTVAPEDPESKKMIYQAKGIWELGRWSPTANQVLVWEHVSPNENHLYILDVDTGEMKNLFSKETSKVHYGSAVWNKDGKSIYFVSDKDREFMTLRHLDLPTGNVRPITAHIPWDVEDCIQSQDGNYLALTINEEAASTLYILDTQTQKTWKVDDLPDGLVVGIAFHPQRNEIGFTHVCSEGVESVYSYDVDSNKLSRWIYKGPDDADRLSPVRLIHYPTFDKVNDQPRMIPAFVFPASPNFEGPRPVWIDLHGGFMEQARSISRNRPPFNYIRKEGITIIAPNFRGSSGYGKTYIALDNGYLRENSVRDIGALLDWISTQPDLDAQRVAVVGASCGGYMTLASLTHYSDRLRCGIDLFGISNLVTFLENSEEWFRDYRRAEYGDERKPEVRAFLESISPSTNADKINVPLFVFHGKNDMLVPVVEARQIVGKVRAQGGEVWYIEAANEGHGLTRPGNALYVSAATVAFLKKHLLEKD